MTGAKVLILIFSSVFNFGGGGGSVKGNFKKLIKALDSFLARPKPGGGVGINRKKNTKCLHEAVGGTGAPEGHLGVLSRAHC